MSVRIMSQNYIDPDLLANFDVSSEAAGFPKENAFNQARRSKVWRTGGRWVIETGTILFRETTAGTDLTATVTPGTYSPTSALLTALTTAFNNAPGSGSTYSAAVDTASGKIKITSDGTGGGNDFEVDWTDPVSQEMADILGFIADDAGALSYTADVLKLAHPDEWVLWDMGIETNPRNFLVTGPRNTPIGLSPSGTYKLQGNETNPTVWSSPSYETTLAYDDEIILKLSDAGLHTEGLRYWRLGLNDVGDTGTPLDGNANGYLAVGSFFLGDELFSSLTDDVNRGCVRFGFSSRYVDRSSTDISDGGNTTSFIKPQSQEYTFSWNAVTKEQIAEVTEFFERVGTHTGFFIVFDPSGPINWTAVNRSAKFVKFVSEPSWDIEFTDFFTPLTMVVREEL